MLRGPELQLVTAHSRTSKIDFERSSYESAIVCHVFEAEDHLDRFTLSDEVTSLGKWRCNGSLVNSTYFDDVLRGISIFERAIRVP